MSDPVIQADARIDEETLANALVASGRVSQADLNRVNQVRALDNNRASLSVTLVRLGILSDSMLAERIADTFDIPLIKAKAFPTEPLLADQLSYRFLKEHHLLPLDLQDDCLRVVLAHPDNQFAIDALETVTGYQILPLIGIATEIETAIEQLYGEAVEPNELASESELDQGLGAQADIEQLKDMASEAPVIRLVNNLIRQAAELGASDIHVEPFETCLKVRYRVDGVLRTGEMPQLDYAPAVVSRIKLMARLNIAERRLPQDGRIKIRAQGKALDIRVSTVPTLFGESVVLRLLDRESISLQFEHLGFETDLLNSLKQMLSIPQGMLIVTGPTGSGKTTTLYTALSQLNSDQRMLITVEDPVEYYLEGINQIQVNSAIGLTFSKALRSIVRQDPDVIMVGEMRDLETARICVQSALTGHLVLSTLHTNSASGTVTRLLEMGVEEYLLTSTLNAILSQRLVRKLCEHCRKPYEPTSDFLVKLGISVEEDQSYQLYKAVGCEHCYGLGYGGRIAIAELLVLNNELRTLILDRADSTQIHSLAVAQGMQTMYIDGVRKALNGLTTLDEVMRVTQEV